MKKLFLYEKNIFIRKNILIFIFIGKNYFYRKKLFLSEKIIFIGKIFLSGKNILEYPNNSHILVPVSQILFAGMSCLSQQVICTKPGLKWGRVKNAADVEGLHRISNCASENSS